MDKFEQKGMEKIRPVKDTWYDWLINYIPQSITKIVGGFNDKIVNIFNTSTPKQNVCRRKKKLSKPKTKNKINNIRNPFILKRKYRIIRDILILFETEEEKKKERNSRKKRN